MKYFLIACILYLLPAIICVFDAVLTFNYKLCTAAFIPGLNIILSFMAFGDIVYTYLT